MRTEITRSRFAHLAAAILFQALWLSAGALPSARAATLSGAGGSIATTPSTPTASFTTSSSWQYRNPCLYPRGSGVNAVSVEWDDDPRFGRDAVSVRLSDPDPGNQGGTSVHVYKNGDLVDSFELATSGRAPPSTSPSTSRCSARTSCA